MIGRSLALVGADPMLDTDSWWSRVLAIAAAKALAIFVIGLVATMFMVWFERKIVAGMQNRVGPNKAGPFGILQTLADGTKLFFKEDLIPEKADRWVFRLAPFLALVPAFLIWSVIPLGGDFTDGKDGTVTWFGEVTRVQLVDPPVGILLVLALSSIGVYGIMLAGWSSGSKYPLLGSVRASAQMISYEAALGLSLAAVLLMSGTLSTSGIVAVQDRLLDWNIVTTGFIPFIVFLIAMTAELNRPPFDLVEAEQELVGGFHTEYSSFRFALFYLAEFMNAITMSAIIVTLFLGGPAGPAWFGPGWLSGIVWFTLKLFVFLFAFVWARATVPRFRYDQLMGIGWKVLIPLALGWLLLLGAINIGRDEGWNMVAVVAVSLLVIVVAWGALTGAIDVAERRRLSTDDEEVLF